MINIRVLSSDEQYPLELLLLADPSQQLVEQYVKRGECFIAENEHGIAGVYVLLPTRPATVELVNIAVSEHMQGCGIGKQLIAHAIATSKLQGYKTLQVGTGNSSIGQLALYQKCGFRIVGVDVDFFVKHYDEDIYENGIQCRDMIRLELEL